MTAGFSSFVILADMRTGSNVLEDKLNTCGGLTSYGELFNPHFIGSRNTTEAFGMTCAERDADPLRLLKNVFRSTGGLPGFRLFSDHDRRVLDACLADKACAKVVLTRNPLESYISLKIALDTDQWWLGDLKTAIPGTAQFDAAEFAAYRAARSDYLSYIRRTLQTTGQTAYWISHADLNDAEVLEGLAGYLGVPAPGTPKRRLRPQNPVPMSEKVANYDEMMRALQSDDPLGLEDHPVFEPPRGPNVPAMLACRTAPLLYLPVKCAADVQVRGWMAATDGIEPDALEHGFTQKRLRQWKRQRQMHRSFTVVAHPLSRAHDAFCRFILPTGNGAFTSIRKTLSRSYNVPLPDDPMDQAYDAAAHHAAFLGFLTFLKGNLAGQTAVRIDAAWASQTAVLQGIASVCIPDSVLKAESLSETLTRLSQDVGAAPVPIPDPPTVPYPLADIYDTRLETAARAAYQRDYMMFGYGPWRAG